MGTRLGDRETFAIEIGAVQSGDLRNVDLWAAGVHLTTDDNMTFVPSFGTFLRNTATQVRQRQVESIPCPGRSPEEVFDLLEADESEFRERYWFMRWGETVDNLSVYAYLDDDLVIVFSFWRPTHHCLDQLGRVFAVKIPPDDFAGVLEQASALLEAGRMA